MILCSFTLPGQPQTKGSARAFVRGKRAVVTNDNPKAKRWQRELASMALVGRKVEGPVEGAVAVSVVLLFPRPKSHWGVRGLKPSAPLKHAQRPDVDKVVRVVLDALTGVAYHDDSQVAALAVRKGWDDKDGVGRVTVEVFR